jgi:hypothetical protein
VIEIVPESLSVLNPFDTVIVFDADEQVKEVLNPIGFEQDTVDNVTSDGNVISSIPPALILCDSVNDIANQPSLPVTKDPLSILGLVNTPGLAVRV